MAFSHSNKLSMEKEREKETSEIISERDILNFCFQLSGERSFWLKIEDWTKSTVTLFYKFHVKYAYLVWIEPQVYLNFNKNKT